MESLDTKSILLLYWNIELCHVTCYSTKHLLIHFDLKTQLANSFPFLASAAITHSACAQQLIFKRINQLLSWLALKHTPSLPLLSFIYHSSCALTLSASVSSLSLYTPFAYVSSCTFLILFFFPHYLPPHLQHLLVRFVQPNPPLVRWETQKKVDKKIKDKKKIVSLLYVVMNLWAQLWSGFSTNGEGSPRGSPTPGLWWSTLGRTVSASDLRSHKLQHQVPCRSDLLSNVLEREEIRLACPSSPKAGPTTRTSWTNMSEKRSEIPHTQPSEHLDKCMKQEELGWNPKAKLPPLLSSMKATATLSLIVVTEFAIRCRADMHLPFLEEFYPHFSSWSGEDNSILMEKTAEPTRLNSDHPLSPPSHPSPQTSATTTTTTTKESLPHGKELGAINSFLTENSPVTPVITDGHEIGSSPMAVPFSPPNIPQGKPVSPITAGKPSTYTSISMTEAQSAKRPQKTTDESRKATGSKRKKLKIPQPSVIPEAEKPQVPAGQVVEHIAIQKANRLH
ncbi:hypothetical protein VP01_2400g2 [Puccinia sorghi]|uniref:Uncharacterized protein n=1 Tax=Puccinia sorghi TaxID=27349 RepID=A0A0L6V7F5_9BASI|nr:hypothetical protein VP01_2400g2 [Puccinia sorghi]